MSLVRSMKKNKKNLLILGASGAVAHTVLTYLKNHRHLFNKLVLVDKRNFQDDVFRTLEELDAKFVKLNVIPKHAKEFTRLLRNHKIDIALDLSDAGTQFTSELIFEYGKTSYICCGFSTPSFAPLGEALNEWIDEQNKKSKPRLPHIFFTGMNPGAVNVWAAIGIEKFGVPNEIIEFEYDTSAFLRAHKEKMVTWCIQEFIVEVVTDPAEVILGDHKIKSFFPNGLYHTEELEPLFSPILKLPKYPRGAITTHEECVTLGNKFNIPAKFLYTVDPTTMAYVKKLYDAKGCVEEEDLVLGNNVDEPLIGADNIALRLDYDDKAVYYFNSAANNDHKECSGTDFQVAIGVYAALFTMLFSDLKPGIHYPEDLLGTLFPKFLTDNMMIQEFVFEKHGDHLTQVAHDPRISYGEGEFIRM